MRNHSQPRQSVSVSPGGETSIFDQFEKVAKLSLPRKSKILWLVGRVEQEPQTRQKVDNFLLAISYNRSLAKQSISLLSVIKAETGEEEGPRRTLVPGQPRKGEKHMSGIRKAHKRQTSGC